MVLVIDTSSALSALALLTPELEPVREIVRESGREFKELPREEMEELWDATKNAEEELATRELAKAQARK